MIFIFRPCPTTVDTLSPSNDLHITPQISIASKFVGPVDVWSLTHRQGRWTTPGTLTVGDSTSGTAMYEPNQFCMNCGMVDDNAGPIRFSSPIGRNLNDGDSIILLVRPNTSQATSVQGTCRYAITLQWSSHYTSNFNCIKICGARRCLIINTPSGAVILTAPS